MAIAPLVDGNGRGASAVCLRALPCLGTLLAVARVVPAVCAAAVMMDRCP